MSPQSQEESASMLTVFIVSQCYTNYFQGEHVNIRPSSLKSNSLITVSKQTTCIIMEVWCRKTFGSKDRAQKRVNLQFLRMITLKMR